MKRCFIALTALILSFSLVACGTKTADEPVDVSAPGAAAPAEQAEQAEQIENKVDLELDSTHYELDAQIAVTLDFGKLDQDAAVIAVVSADSEHGKPIPYDDNTTWFEYRWLADFSELPFYLFPMNLKDGLYDVRVYADGESGLELASVTFSAGSAKLPEATDTGAGSGSTSGSDSVVTYAEAYEKYAAVYEALYNAYSAILEPHNLAIEESSGDYWDDPEHFSDVVTGFVNIPIAYTATLGEDGYETSVAALLDMFGLTDGSVEQLDASDYRMTYTGVYTDAITWESVEDAPWESLCAFDAERGSLSFRHYVTLEGEKKLDSFIECVPLGGGKYALQSKFERGIVEMTNGEASAFEYAAFSTPFDPEAVSIYPDAAGAIAAWITSGEGMYQHITLTSDSLHIWADEIADGIMAAPVRDITIVR